MKTLCKTLAYVELVLGTIGSIILTYTLGTKLDYHTLKFERDGAATFAIFVSAMLSVIILWAILCAFSKILENQEIIFELLESRDETKPTNITPICTPLPEPAKTLPVRPQVQPQTVRQEPIDTKINDENWKVYDAWKCPNCKRINDGSAVTCVCGTNKPI
ncbi:hypothetical protein [Lacrimispora sp.]|uniref:hypothetical protein n=1 Tax=Lacrimispora sp. TaxID=2719234 RepID=UPI0028A23176|nr:hypothetical protein [Lacrimispora sp.]